MNNWFLTQVKPNASHIAKRNLERQSFTTFQPLEKQTIARAGRLVDRLRAYFPGYMFVSHSDQFAPWHLVNSTYGIARLVKFGELPAPVPPAIIKELQAACNTDGVITHTAAPQPGSMVEVTTGAFASFVGRIERLAPGDRAMVLLDFMGKQTKVNVSARHMRPANQCPEVKKAV